MLHLPTLALLTSCVAAAQPVTLDAALARAEAGDPSLLAAGERLAAARELKRQAGTWTSNPTLELGYATAAVSGGGDQSASVTVSQAIPVAGQAGARVREAELRIGAAEQALAARRLLVRADVTLAFQAAMVARARVALRVQASELAGALAAVAARLVEAHQVAAIDQLQADVDKARAEGSLLAAEADLAEAMATLRGRLRMKEGEPIELAGTMMEGGPVPDVDALVRTAAEARPDIRAVLAGADAEDAAADVLGREVWSDLVVGAGWQRDVAAIGSLTGTDDFLVVRLSMPLPVVNRNTGAISAAHHRASASRAEADALRATVERRIREAAARLAAESKRFGALSAALPTDEQAAALVRKGYEGGQLRITDVLAARDRSLRLREDVLDAQIAVVRARVALMRAAGLETLP